MRGFVNLLSQLQNMAQARRDSHFKIQIPQRAVASGLERASTERYARRHGVRIRVKWSGNFDFRFHAATTVPRPQLHHVDALRKRRQLRS